VGYLADTAGPPLGAVAPLAARSHLTTYPDNLQTTCQVPMPVPLARNYYSSFSPSSAPTYSITSVGNPAMPASGSSSADTRSVSFCMNNDFIFGTSCQ
jgi:hypothetical protein